MNSSAFTHKPFDELRLMHRFTGGTAAILPPLCDNCEVNRSVRFYAGRDGSALALCPSCIALAEEAKAIDPDRSPAMEDWAAEKWQKKATSTKLA